MPYDYLHVLAQYKNLALYYPTWAVWSIEDYCLTDWSEYV